MKDVSVVTEATKGAKGESLLKQNKGRIIMQPVFTISQNHHYLPKMMEREVPFMIWKHEVECITNEGNSNQTIAHAIRDIVFT